MPFGKNVTLFYAALLEAAQIYSLVEAAQMKPIEKPMYRSGCRVTLLVIALLEHAQFYSFAEAAQL